MTKLNPLRRQDGRVRTDACAKEYMRQAREAEKKVHVELRWGDAKELSELLVTLLDLGKVDLTAPRGHVGARVGLIDRVITAVACSSPAITKKRKG